jgi:hypothetical protein
MPLDQSAIFRRYRAPKADGQKLLEPSWPELPELVSRNQRQLALARLQLQGKSLAELLQSARRGLLAAAIDYTRQYRDVPSAITGAASGPVILSGHQPQLYHAGVWYKNFVLGALARRVGGVGVHLLIDSDLCRGVSIRVPAGEPAAPRIETVSYDLPATEVPYEERQIRDRDTFHQFGGRVAAAVKPFVAQPLVNTLWPLVLERSRELANLGLCLAQGRHLVEASWNNETLELPQSTVCQLPEFTWFAAHLLANLPNFQKVHNAALASYRAAHRLRNRAQPVPDLANASDGWREAPLWIWAAEDPRRRPLFARPRAGQIEISDLHRHTFALKLSIDSEATTAVEQLLELAKQGVRIRTRALTTTMFARLLLGDLFLHGIGGAKYDQVTNLIAAGFLGLELPEFAVVSATLKLPVDRSVRLKFDPDLEQRIRELQFHPERFLVNNQSQTADASSQAAQMSAEKLRWIRIKKTPKNARERHLAIGRANTALQPFVAGTRRQMEQQLRLQQTQEPAVTILDSREYSFCLHSREHIQRSLLDELRQDP